ncbi:bifunctional glutamate N-acetyltransferase/amino-acid acetyltransferase ArgJ [Oleidesulfovibrio sp.]|uniref:bifunctional glutamate N-acetyltransferase/amino-acid acetyltransferase ArgJ n=1 Tax=Oleidesulfovibrio sp. TaxID=2909707 RepID=UPI003A84C84B
MTAIKGFSFAAVPAGFKKADRLDLGLIVSERPASAAGVFTTNLFKAAPVIVAMEAVASGTAQAIVINSGQANACTGAEGLENCRTTLRLLSEATGIPASAILPASTGVIGQQLKMDLWRTTVPALAKNLGNSTLDDFARAIMTTDSFPKTATATVNLAGGQVTLAGVAKGAGMICPTMATMLSVLLCDADVPTDTWQQMFRTAVAESFNRVTVDGDTSTNDTVFGLANGASGVKVLPEELPLLQQAVTALMSDLAYMLVQDGEGATKVLRINVQGATDTLDAEKAARTVGHSQLVKTAFYGKDANWGRIVAALGRSGAKFNPDGVSVTISGVTIFKDGAPTDIDADALLKEPLEQIDINVDIKLGSGSGTYTLLASDLTHEYVSINADYRT